MKKESCTRCENPSCEKLLHSCGRKETTVFERLDKLEFAVKMIALAVENGEWIGVSKQIKEILK